MVTIPPEVVRIRASSTVFVKASSLWNLDLTGIVVYFGICFETKDCGREWAFRSAASMYNAAQWPQKVCK